MTLSGWVRDYLYIPLGGNRHGKLKTYRNLMLTMLLGGLWHGASWNFVLWGGLHGCALAVNHWWREYRHGRQSSPSALGKVASWAGTYAFICLTWSFPLQELRGFDDHPDHPAQDLRPRYEPSAVV